MAAFLIFSARDKQRKKTGFAFFLDFVLTIFPANRCCPKNAPFSRLPILPRFSYSRRPRKKEGENEAGANRTQIFFSLSKQESWSVWKRRSLSLYLASRRNDVRPGWLLQVRAALRKPSSFWPFHICWLLLESPTGAHNKIGRRKRGTKLLRSANREKERAFFF